jgi:endonuclease YncB( thermonuclease family)
MFKANKQNMRAIIVAVSIVLTTPGWALDLTVKDANSLQLGGIAYRLDGIDAPELDQMCVNDQADQWACGIDTRDSVAKLIGSRDLSCKDLGPDAGYKGRRIGLCVIAGEPISLNQTLVREGLAINADSPGKERFAADQADARANHRGLWHGCFVAPQQFRRWDKTAALLGASCREDKKSELLALLFPDDPAMPPSCAIKARFSSRARFTGNVGIYHLQGCISYATVTKPNRWFCSEDDAKAAGFRKAYNCRSKTRAP